MPDAFLYSIHSNYFLFYMQFIGHYHHSDPLNSGVVWLLLSISVQQWTCKGFPPEQLMVQRAVTTSDYWEFMYKLIHTRLLNTWVLMFSVSYHTSDRTTDKKDNWQNISSNISTLFKLYGFIHLYIHIFIMYFIKKYDFFRQLNLFCSTKHHVCVHVLYLIWYQSFCYDAS